MKKTIFAVVALVCGLMFLPTVSADEAQYGTIVSDITNVDSVEKGYTYSASATTGADITVTYKNLKMKTLAAGTEGASEGRPEGKAWVGIQIQKPTGVEKIEYDLSGTKGEWTTGETEDFYFGIDFDDLKEATENETAIVKTLKLTWEKDNQQVVQTINVVINPKDVTLTDEINNKPWDPETDVEKYAPADEEATETESTTEEALDDVPKTGDGLSFFEWLISLFR